MDRKELKEKKLTLLEELIGLGAEVVAVWDIRNPEPICHSQV